MGENMGILENKKVITHCFAICYHFQLGVQDEDIMLLSYVFDDGQK